MSDTQALTEKVMDCLMDGYLGKHSDRHIADGIVKIVDKHLERERDGLRAALRYIAEGTYAMSKVRDIARDALEAKP